MKWLESRIFHSVTYGIDFLYAACVAIFDAMTDSAHKVALITGGGTGIGRALACSLASQGVTVYIVGRRQSKLKETQAIAPDQIHIIEADISRPECRRKIQKKLMNIHLNYLVHNAATAQPLKHLEKVSLEEWRNHFAINLEAPMFLTQLLLSNLVVGARVLHLSSGLAHSVCPGAGVYCISKAALHMLYRVWSEELRAKGILVGSVQPGVVDTEMQSQLRDDESSHEFPSRGLFKLLHAENQLMSADKVASFLKIMLLEMDSDEYEKKDWQVGVDLT